MSKLLELDKKNKLKMNKDEVLRFIDRENRITVIFENGFEIDSDTEDVFRGMVGDIAFEENEELMSALHSESEFRHTFFLNNAPTETPFNERGLVKRLIKDNHWTQIILHDHPLKDGLYAMVENSERK